MDSLLDVLIIGAGASGIATYASLKAASSHSLKLHIIEARDRIGGRIWTVQNDLPFPLELGAEFIHGDNAVTHAFRTHLSRIKKSSGFLVQMSGLSAIDVARFDRNHMFWAASPGACALNLSKLPVKEQILLDKIVRDFSNLGNANIPDDISYADYLRSLGYKPEEIQKAEVRCALTWCTSAERLSVWDVQREENVDHAGEGEWRIKEGYEALLTALLGNQPSISFGKKVKSIAYSQGLCGVRTENGELFRAKKVVVTVPIELLKKNTINFEPPLPEVKQLALSMVHTEAATKILFAFDERLWPAEMTYLCHTGLFPRWWVSSWSRESSIHIISCFATAERAQVIDAMTEEEVTQQGLSELSSLLGLNLEELKSNLLFSKRVSWAKDPLAQGGYANVEPGVALDVRRVLSAPIEKTIFFAGESLAYFTNCQTVHGALESGHRTALEVFSSIKPPAKY